MSTRRHSTLDEWTPILDEAQLADETPTAARADGLAVVLVRSSGQLYALDDRCSHRGCALHEGRLTPDETLSCPCHGSTFRLDGSVVKGPATSRQPAFDIRANGGNLEIRARTTA